MSTHAGKEVYVCIGLDPSADLADIAAFEALTWVRVNGCGTTPRLGARAPIGEYQAFDKVHKGKGVTNFQGGEIAYKVIPGDTGQTNMRTAGADGYSLHVALKIVYKDATGSANPAYGPTTDYAKGVLTGPDRPDGAGEDFIIESYEFGCEQWLVDHAAQIAP